MKEIVESFKSALAAVAPTTGAEEDDDPAHSVAKYPRPTTPQQMERISLEEKVAQSARDSILSRGLLDVDHANELEDALDAFKDVAANCRILFALTNASMSKTVKHQALSTLSKGRPSKKRTALVAYGRELLGSATAPKKKK